MNERVCALCHEGENCSRVILRTASERYHFPISQELHDSCNAICSGFGVGGICSAIVAGIMVIGIVCPPEETKQKTLLLLLEVQERWGELDCCKLSAKREDCEELLESISEMLEGIIGETSECFP